MSNKNDIDQLIFDRIKGQVKQLNGRRRRFDVMLRLHKSERWTRDNMNGCWFIASDVNGMEAAIYDMDLNSPELCAGFAKYHDQTFEIFEWAEISPAWTKETVPMTPAHAHDMDMNHLAQEFLDENPWLHELDKWSKKSEDEEE